MPVKRRRPKQRRSIEAEVQAWSVLFESGYDFFNHLAPLGFANEAEARRAAPDAWARCGDLFLDSYEPPPHDPDRVPWPLTEFGEP